MNNSYLRWAINIRELERSVNFENFYRFAVQCVTEKEYEEHRKFVYKDDSLACLVSRLLARKFGAIATTSQWNRVDIQRTKRGKPFVNSPSTSQRFNISHQGDYVVLASDSQYEIGIDVMKIDEREDATADEHRQKMQRLFTQGEHSYMASRRGEFERWKAFYRIWTLKEAFLKATGEGLINDLKRVDFQVDERENEAQMKLGTSVRKDGILQEEFIFEESSIDNRHVVAVATIISVNSARDARLNLLKSNPFHFQSLCWERLLDDAQVLNPLIDSGIDAYSHILNKCWKPF